MKLKIVTIPQILESIFTILIYVLYYYCEIDPEKKLKTNIDP